jgi:hypothetical protein
MSTKKEEQKQHSRSSDATSPQETRKEVEKLTEQDAKKRKDATTVAKKLEPILEEREGKNQVLVKGLDESKKNIMEAIKETIAEIPRFTQIVKDFQDTAIDLSDCFIESQRQVISSLQLIPSRDKSGSIWSYWTFQPTIADIYLRMFRITVDTAIATNRLMKNLIFANLEAASSLLTDSKDKVR